MALDPDYQPILDEMALARLDVEAVRPAELRELMKAVRPVTSEPRAMESVEDCAIDGPAGPLPVRIYPEEGIAQVIFLEGPLPETSYADRKGKYQAQKKITLSKV